MHKSAQPVPPPSAASRLSPLQSRVYLGGREYLPYAQWDALAEDCLRMSASECRQILSVWEDGDRIINRCEREAKLARRRSRRAARQISAATEATVP